MKKIYFAFLLLSLLSHAQNKTIQIVRNDSLGAIEYKPVTKFIRVEVQDSVRLKVSSYNLLVSINQYPYKYSEKDSVTYDFRTIDQKVFDGNKARFEKFLRSNGYDFREYPFDQGLPDNKPVYPTNYLVNVAGTNNEMNSLISDLRKFDFIVYDILGAHYENEDHIDEILFGKLIAHAKRKALKLSKLAGVKLGKVIEINENTTGYMAGSGQRNPDNSLKVRSAIVKFAIE